MSENKKGNVGSAPSSACCSSGNGLDSAKIQVVSNTNLSISSENSQDHLQDRKIHEVKKEIQEKFTDKKKQSQALSCRYRELSEDFYKADEDGVIQKEHDVFLKKSDKVSHCGSFLTYQIFPHPDVKSKLVQANFCKDRLCPMCSWRRSMKIFTQTEKIIQFIEDHEEKYGKVYFIFLTLTVRNCSGDELPDMVDKLLKGYRFLYHKSSLFKKDGVVLGTMRALEVTKNKNKRSKNYGTFHPHLHVILAVSQKYFDENYHTTNDFSKLWQKCMKLDYEPITFIEKIYSKDNRDKVGHAVAEVSKYLAKGSDYIADRETVYQFHKALANRKLLGLTGIFAKVKKKLKFDDMEDGDLLRINDEEEISLPSIYKTFFWRTGCYVEM